MLKLISLINNKYIINLNFFVSFIKKLSYINLTCAFINIVKFFNFFKNHKIYIFFWADDIILHIFEDDSNMTRWSFLSHKHICDEPTRVGYRAKQVIFSMRE